MPLLISIERWPEVSQSWIKVVPSIQHTGYRIAGCKVLRPLQSPKAISRNTRILDIPLRWAQTPTSYLQGNTGTLRLLQYCNHHAAICDFCFASYVYSRCNIILYIRDDWSILNCSREWKTERSALISYSCPVCERYVTFRCRYMLVEASGLLGLFSIDVLWSSQGGAISHYL